MCFRECTNSKSKSTPSNALGAWGFGISLFGLLFTLGILCPLGLLLSFFGLFSKNRGFAIAGLILGAVGSAIVGVGVGTVALAASAMHHYRVEVPKIEETRQVLNVAVVEIESFRQEHGKLPDGIEGNKLVLKFQDAYGNEVRFEPEDNGDYAIRSAGSDGEFDTEDDLRMLNSKEGLASQIASAPRPHPRSHGHGFGHKHRGHW